MQKIRKGTDSYHAINYKYGFKFLRHKKFSNVLGFGSAYGDEFKPILNKIESVTIVESSDVFIGKEISGFPISYIRQKLTVITLSKRFF